MCEDINARILIKQGSGVPTIPASTDHRNGDWISTDIYEGEFYMDTDTGLTYTSNGGTIIASSGLTPSKVWKAVIVQASTTAPTITVIENTLGVTVATNYIAPGSYTLTGFSSKLVGNVSIGMDFQHSYLEHSRVLIPTSSTLSLGTYLSGVLANDVLASAGIIRTLTVTVY